MTSVVDHQTQTPYDFLPEDYAYVLRQLLALVPDAQMLFDEGKVPAALAVLRAAKNVRLKPQTGMTMDNFLAHVAFAMPNMYSV